MQVCLSNLCVYDAHIHCKIYTDVLCNFLCYFQRHLLWFHPICIMYQFHIKIHCHIVLLPFYAYFFTSFIFVLSNYLSTFGCLVYPKCFMPNLLTCLIFAKQRALSLFTSVKRTCFILLTHLVVCRHWLSVDLRKQIRQIDLAPSLPLTSCIPLMCHGFQHAYTPMFSHLGVAHNVVTVHNVNRALLDITH